MVAQIVFNVMLKMRHSLAKIRGIGGNPRFFIYAPAANLSAFFHSWKRQIQVSNVLGIKVANRVMDGFSFVLGYFIIYFSLIYF